MLNLSKIFQHALVVAFLSGVLGLVVSNYFDFKNRMYEGLFQIQAEVTKTINQDELAYVFCSQYRSTSSVDSCSNNIEEYKLIEKLADNLFSIFASLQKMGKFLPYETFEAIFQLNCFQNKLLLQTKQICSSSMLINPEKLDMWHEKINIMLEANRRQYYGVMYSIKAYFTYVFTNKINEQHAYDALNYGKASSCQIFGFSSSIKEDIHTADIKHV